MAGNQGGCTLTTSSDTKSPPPRGDKNTHISRCEPPPKVDASRRKMCFYRSIGMISLTYKIRDGVRDTSWKYRDSDIESKTCL